MSEDDSSIDTSEDDSSVDTSEDDASIDTTSAVGGEFSDKRRCNNADSSPFLALRSPSSSDRSTGSGEVAAASPKKVRIHSGKGGTKRNKLNHVLLGNTKEEFDAEPVHRRMGTRNCEETGCPNKGGKCGDHGKLRLTCKLKGCQLFVQAKGLCNKHHSKLGPDPDSKRKKAVSVGGSAKGKKKVVSGENNKNPKSSKKREYRRESKGGNKRVSHKRKRLGAEEKLAVLRELSGEDAPSVHELAERVGVTSQSICNWKKAQEKLVQSVEKDGNGMAAPSKKQKHSHSPKDKGASSKENDESEDLSSDTEHFPAGATCVGKPLSYMGNHISDLLQKDGWTNVNRKVDKINFGQVLFRKGCNKKTAEEGSDKLTGFVAVAKWAHFSGYYERKVVNTNDGKKVLKRMGIEDDPYSIFESESKLPNGQVENDAQVLGSSVNADREQDTQHYNLPSRRSANSGSNENANPIALPNPDAEDDVSSSSPAHIRDEDEGGSNKNNNEPINFDNGTDEFMEMFESIQDSFTVATKNDDAESMVFFGYLLRYFNAKADKLNFSLGSDKISITEAVKSFESTKEKVANAIEEGRSVYKNLLTHITNKCKEKLPLC